MLKRYGVGAFGLVVGSFAVAACGSDSVPAAADAGGDTRASCDPQKDATCINDEKGVFVKAGAQGGDGTRAKPFGKIQEGIDAATATKTRVYVCEGDYAEAVSIKKALGVYGGLTVCDAATWTPTVGRVSKVRSAVGYALDASVGSIELTDLSFTAPDFAGQTEAADGAPGKSSIAAFVHYGADVQAKRTTFVAQGGGNAEPTIDEPSGSGAPGARGGNADTTAVGAGGTSSCGVAGGKGGKGGSSDDLEQSTHGSPAPANDTVVEGRRGCNRNVIGPTKCEGGAGACGNGIPGAGGTAKTATPGTTLLQVRAAGATPAVGETGATGGAGGGGGGGAGLPGQNGGGGGSGGCGGAGGKGGGAGGSSIAIVVHDARFTCSESCVAKVGTAGNGGKGQKGQRGGMGADSGASAAACVGGSGGGGAGGQGGQGGAGGLATGVAFGGPSFVTWAGQSVSDSLTELRDVTPGTPGKPGEGGEPGEPGPSNGVAGSPGAPGAPGPSEATASAAKKL